MPHEWRALKRRRLLRHALLAAAVPLLARHSVSRNDGDLPPFARTRAEWDAAPLRGPMRPHRIERITLHHTGPPSWFGSPPAAVYLRRIQAFHQGPERRWPEIAYHLLIDLDGAVWEGRPIGFAGDTATAYDPEGHALIAVLGDYGVQQPNEAQWKALVESARWLTRRFSLDAGVVAAHRDYAATTCPGRNLYRLVTEIRAALGA